MSARDLRIVRSSGVTKLVLLRTARIVKSVFAPHHSIIKSVPLVNPMIRPHAVVNHILTCNLVEQFFPRWGTVQDAVTYGEALIADLGGRRTIYILPVQHPPKASLAQVYEYGILSTFGIKNSIGSLTDADFSTLRNVSGRNPFKLHGTTRLPSFVSFTDESDPKTIFEIQPSEVGRYVAGAKFTGLYIEITDEPVTRALRDRLSWLQSARDPKIFPRDPRTSRRPYSELPLSHMITPADFFGDGSR